MRELDLSDRAASWLGPHDQGCDIHRSDMDDEQEVLGGGLVGRDIATADQGLHMSEAEPELGIGRSRLVVHSPATHRLGPSALTGANQENLDPGCVIEQVVRGRTGTDAQTVWFEGRQLQGERRGGGR